MGMFMASVAFSCPDKQLWKEILPKIENMIADVDGLVSNFQEDGPGYCIVSPFGDMAPLLVRLPQHISVLTGGYAVFANCVDSDFNMINLWHNGQNLEEQMMAEDNLRELSALTNLPIFHDKILGVCL